MLLIFITYNNTLIYLTCAVVSLFILPTNESSYLTWAASVKESPRKAIFSLLLYGLEFSQTRFPISLKTTLKPPYSPTG